MATVETFGVQSVIIVGDAIVSLLNSKEWTPEADGSQPLLFTARRLYQVPEYKPHDTRLYVDLVAAEQTKEIADRGDRSVERTFNIAIGVQKVLADKHNVAEVDALVNFVGALSDFFEFEAEIIAAGSQKVRCTDNRIAPICNPQELDLNSRFFGLIHLTFAGWYDG